MQACRSTGRSTCHRADACNSAVRVSGGGLSGLSCPRAGSLRDGPRAGAPRGAPRSRRRRARPLGGVALSAHGRAACGASCERLCAGHDQQAPAEQSGACASDDRHDAGHGRQDQEDPRWRDGNRTHRDRGESARAVVQCPRTALGERGPRHQDRRSMSRQAFLSCWTSPSFFCRRRPPGSRYVSPTRRVLRCRALSCRRSALAGS